VEELSVLRNGFLEMAELRSVSFGIKKRRKVKLYYPGDAQRPWRVLVADKKTLLEVQK
jgi:hypothetical protein